MITGVLWDCVIWKADSRIGASDLRLAFWKFPYIFRGGREAANKILDSYTSLRRARLLNIG